MYSIKIEHHEMITEPVVRVRHCDSMRTQVISGQKVRRALLLVLGKFETRSRLTMTNVG